MFCVPGLVVLLGRVEEIIHGEVKNRGNKNQEENVAK